MLSSCIFSFDKCDHPKCKDLVVAYKNQTIGALFREEVQAHLLYGR